MSTKNEYEIIERMGECALIKKYKPKISYLLVKVDEKGYITEEKEIDILREEEIRNYTEDSNESGFILYGILKELHVEGVGKSGFGVLDKNGMIVGFWFKKNNKEIVDCLKDSVGDYFILEGTYKSNYMNFNVKKPVFNYIEKATKK